MDSSSNSQLIFDSEKSECCEQVQIPLKKFKPWVYRPKKVKYSLEGGQLPRKSFSTSHWTPQENKKYLQFLSKFKSVITGPKKNRRKWHLNRILSKEVGTRSHQQCRSHHQKMMKHYKTVDGIIHHLDKLLCQNSQIQAENSFLQQNQDLKAMSEMGQISNFWNLEYSLGIQLPNPFNFQDSDDLI